MKFSIKLLALFLALGFVCYMLLAFWTSKRGGAYPWDRGATRWIISYRTKIEFYGKAIDQFGDPVEGATVKIILIDNPFGEDSSPAFNVKTDAEGRFAVKGRRGLSMGVDVTKEGYLSRSDFGWDKPASHRVIEYGFDGTGGSRFKDPSNPTLFQLHKLGPMEPLIWVQSQNWRIPLDGSPRRIALDSENGEGPHQIQFSIKSERGMRSKDLPFNHGPFDWEAEIRIPGGGLTKRTSDYLFEAPENGYAEFLVINYPKHQEGWSRSQSNNNYFVRFDDNTYGRIRFKISGDTNTLLLTSWFNPKPGSRNLTTDKINPGDVLYDK